MSDNELSIVGGLKKYGEVSALAGVTLSLRPASITTVIGPSGSGKTTLLRALSLLEPPDAGVVTFDGRQYTFPMDEDVPLHSPWPMVTIVFQHLFLWPHLTIRQNIELPLRFRKDLDGRANIGELCDYFQMGAFEARFPNQVSAGQRQLGAIVRAMALRPKYLLLDEITSALDVEYVGLVLQRLQRLKAEGTGILLVTHLLGFARRAADLVVFMDAGSIVECGPPDILRMPGSDRLCQFLSRMDGVGQGP